MNKKNKKIEIIAEIGMLHDGKLSIAKRLIEKAAQVGASTIKFQTHLADSETLRSAPSPSYFKSESRYQYFKRTAFSLSQWRKIKQLCKAHKVNFLSSPFSIESVELLEKLGVDRYKIPSGEVTNLPMIREIGRTGKPVLLSSGMSNWKELDEAVNALLQYHKRILVMQCTSEYPCSLSRVGLNVMMEMKTRYQLEVGFSDHTMTNSAALAAAAMGASVIEKHLMLDAKMYGSDAKHSIKPDQFGELVKGIREIEMIAVHPVNKNSIRFLRPMKRIFEKSVVSTSQIRKNQKISKLLIGIKKPGEGIAPKYFDEILGMRTKRNISPDQVIRWKDLKR